VVSLARASVLLRNDGAGHFNDVTKEAGLLDPVNSNGAAWADYDNDGWLDLFVLVTSELRHGPVNPTPFRSVKAEPGE
jgi:hypothetical protein